MKALNQVDGPTSQCVLKVGNGKTYTMHSKRIQCQRARVAEKSTAVKKKSTTVFPTNPDHVCSFYFMVYKEKNGDRWFVRQNSQACWTHSYHPPRERRYRVDNLNVLPDDTRETAEALLENLIPASIVNMYIKTTSGLRLSDDSIQHLRKLVLDKKYNLQSESTTAQKLLQILDSSEGMVYVTYTGEHKLVPSLQHNSTIS